MNFCITVKSDDKQELRAIHFDGRFLLQKEILVFPQSINVVFMLAQFLDRIAKSEGESNIVFQNRDFQDMFLSLTTAVVFVFLGDAIAAKPVENKTKRRGANRYLTAHARLKCRATNTMADYSEIRLNI